MTKASTAMARIDTPSFLSFLNFPNFPNFDVEGARLFMDFHAELLVKKND
jgi:hypothetical protein